jgi:hypothetical protein
MSPDPEEYHVDDTDPEAIVDELDEPAEVEVTDEVEVPPAPDEGYPHVEDQEEDRA